MKKAAIRVAVITNHNKFDRDDFRALAKAARKEEIFVLPGLELSVKDGSNGINDRGTRRYLLRDPRLAVERLYALNEITLDEVERNTI